MSTIYILPLLAALVLSQDIDCDAPIDGVSEVVLIGDVGYPQRNTQFGTLMGETSYLKPDLVAMCNGPDEVLFVCCCFVCCSCVYL